MGNPPSKEQSKNENRKSLSNSISDSKSAPIGENTGYTSFSVHKSQDEKPEPGITTVIEHQEQQEEDRELAILDKLPIIIPIIPNSVDVKWLWSKYKVTDDGLDAVTVINICSDVQKFFKKVTVDVVAKQKQITEKIVSTEKRSTLALQGLTTQTSDARYFELQFREVDRLSKTIATINQQLQIALQQAERLYEALPSDEVMETPPWWTPSLSASEVLIEKSEQTKITEEKIFQAASKIDSILKTQKSPVTKEEIPSSNLHNSLSPEYSLDFGDVSLTGK